MSTAPRGRPLDPGRPASQEGPGDADRAGRGRHRHRADHRRHPAGRRHEPMARPVRPDRRRARLDLHQGRPRPGGGHPEPRRGHPDGRALPVGARHARAGRQEAARGAARDARHAPSGGAPGGGRGQLAATPRRPTAWWSSAPSPARCACGSASRSPSSPSAANATRCTYAASPTPPSRASTRRGRPAWPGCCPRRSTRIEPMLGRSEWVTGLRLADAEAAQVVSQRVVVTLDDQVQRLSTWREVRAAMELDNRLLGTLLALFGVVGLVAAALAWPTRPAAGCSPSSATSPRSSPWASPPPGGPACSWSSTARSACSASRSARWPAGASRWRCSAPTCRRADAGAGHRRGHRAGGAGRRRAARLARRSHPADPRRPRGNRRAATCPAWPGSLCWYGCRPRSSWAAGTPSPDGCPRS